jgi:hypothetical protein
LKDDQTVSTCLIRLSYDGKMIWNTTWVDTAGHHGRKMSCGEEGIYVVGDHGGESTENRTYLIKYSFDGERKWVKGGAQIDDVYADNGYVYILDGGTLFKLDGEGVKLWETHTQGYTLCVRGGALYVAGSTAENSSGGHDAIVTAFDLQGSQLWSSRRTSTRGDEANDISVTDEGVYVIGSGTKGWDFSFITKFTSSGEELWDRMMTSTNGTLNSLYSDGRNVYATGALGTSPEFDALVAMFGADGTLIWSDIYGQLGREDYAYSASSEGSTIYVVGTTNVNRLPSERNSFLISYSFQ